MAADPRIDRLLEIVQELSLAATRQSQGLEKLLVVLQRLSATTQGFDRSLDGITEAMSDCRTELTEIREMARIHAATADKQAETAHTQAENVRALIQMLNQKH